MSSSNYSQPKSKQVLLSPSDRKQTLKGDSIGEECEDDTPTEGYEPPSDRFINVEEFLTSLGNNPVYTRALLNSAADQLNEAEKGEGIKLSDCYGEIRKIEPGKDIELGKKHTLLYNNHHILADPEPYYILQQMDSDFQASILRGFGNNLHEMLQYTKHPMYIHFTTPTNFDYDIDLMLHELAIGILLWDQRSERIELGRCLQAMAYTIHVMNIVCFGRSSLARDKLSLMQRVATSWSARKLMQIYKEYTPNDRDLLARLDPQIKILPDPNGFLAINPGSLVMSCFRTVSVKWVTADLAMVWNNSKWDVEHGVDQVTYPWVNVVYFGNPASRRKGDMPEEFEVIMDGAHTFEGWYGDEKVGKENDSDAHIDDGEEEEGRAKSLISIMDKFEVADTEDHGEINAGYDDDNKSYLPNYHNPNHVEECNIDAGETSEDESPTKDIVKSALCIDWLEAMKI